MKMRNYFRSKMISEKNLFLIGVIIIICYYIPYFILGKDSSLPIFDILNVEFVNRITAINHMNGLFNFSARIECLENGIPFCFLPSLLNVYTIFLLLLDPFWAYVLLDLFVKLIAFGSMWVFLKGYILCHTAKKDAVIIFLVSLIFAFIPFLPMHNSASVAAQPLVYFAFLNLLNKRKLCISFLILFIFPFISSLVFIGVFLLVFLSIGITYWAFKHKQVNLYAILGIFILSLGYMFVESGLIYSVLSDFTSTRSIPRLQLNTSVISFPDFFFDLVKKIRLSSTSFHSGNIRINILSLLLLLILIVKQLVITKKRQLIFALTCIIVGAIALFTIDRFWLVSYIKHNIESLFTISFIGVVTFEVYQSKTVFSKYRLLILAAIIGIAGLSTFIQTISFFYKHLFIFTAFDWTRFSFLYHVFYVLLFATILKDMSDLGLNTKVITLIGVIFLFVSFNTNKDNSGIAHRQTIKASLFSSQEEHLYQRNWVDLFDPNHWVNSPSKHKYPSFREYYDTSMFDKVKDYIGKPLSGYRIVSLALDPSILQYNGFYILNGYTNQLEVDHAAKFMEIAKYEIEAYEDVSYFYHQWSHPSMCYIVISSEQYKYTEDGSEKIFDLNLNLQPLIDMGGEYILSGAEINEPLKANLHFEQKFEGLGYNVYLYRINNV